MDFISGWLSLLPPTVLNWPTRFHTSPVKLRRGNPLMGLLMDLGSRTLVLNLSQRRNAGSSEGLSQKPPINFTPVLQGLWSMAGWPR